MSFDRLRARRWKGRWPLTLLGDLVVLAGVALTCSGLWIALLAFERAQ